MIQSVVVFCSSSEAIAPIYFSEMEILAAALAQSGRTIVYGGGKPGLMGRLADVALAHGGQVIGVIPEYLNQPGIVHEGLSELIVVSDLLDRKRKMLSLADAAIASPGGIGTLDEVSEVIALKQLAEHEKPIIFHNFLNFWDPLLEFFQVLHQGRVITQSPEDLYHSCPTVEDILLTLDKG